MIAAAASRSAATFPTPGVQPEPPDEGAVTNGLMSKTYAEPDMSPLSSQYGAPTMAISPLTETELPKESPAMLSEAVSLARSSQVEPLLTYTYAEPEPLPL